MDGWMDGRTEGTDGRMDGETDGRTDGWTDERTEGWTDGRTEGRTDGRTDGQIDGRSFDPLYAIVCNCRVWTNSISHKCQLEKEWFGILPPRLRLSGPPQF